MQFAFRVQNRLKFNLPKSSSERGICQKTIVAQWYQKSLQWGWKCRYNFTIEYI